MTSLESNPKYSIILRLSDIFLLLKEDLENALDIRISAQTAAIRTLPSILLGLAF